jgi:hypothetical protein
MKRTIGLVLIALGGGLMMVSAADDKCTEKSDACKVTCGHQRAQCMARGNNVESCNFRLKQCKADCDNDLKTCQTKAAAKK